MSKSLFLLISSFLVSDMSESLILLNSNEQCERIAHIAHQKWAICSGRSEEMSNHERIAQATHQKWANEWNAHFFERIAHSLIFEQKRAIRSDIKWANSQPCLKGWILLSVLGYSVYLVIITFECFTV